MKKLGSYLIYIVFLGLIVYWGAKYGGELKILAGRTFKPFPSMLFASFFPVVIGVLIAVPGFVLNLNKPGSWNLNWIRLVVIGLPSLFVTCAYLMFYANLGQYLYPVLSLWILNNEVITISGIIFGYTVLASFDKVGECLGH
ncbi:MAG: hypothetical protein P4L59_21865 [Desulfosporosinus sp.]|nr:hypothetical protein [Desulfosporosinus sp.]